MSIAWNKYEDNYQCILTTLSILQLDTYTNIFLVIVWLHTLLSIYFLLIAIGCFCSWTSVAYFTTWNRSVEKLERTEVSFYCSSSVHFINTGQKIPYPILAAYSCGAARSLQRPVLKVRLKILQSFHLMKYSLSIYIWGFFCELCILFYIALLCTETNELFELHKLNFNQGE